MGKKLARENIFAQGLKIDRLLYIPIAILLKRTRRGNFYEKNMHFIIRPFVVWIIGLPNYGNGTEYLSKSCKKHDIVF